MEDTISITVKLRNGGEAMYVTPISYDRYADIWNEEKAKLHNYPTIEFFPKIPLELQRGEERFFHNLQLNYLKYTRAATAFINNLKNSIRQFTGSNVFHPRFKDWTWDLGWYSIGIELENKWFYAHEVFPHTFHINGCLEIDWGESEPYSYWNDNYLTPSSKWIEQRLEDDFQCWGYTKEQ